MVQWNAYLDFLVIAETGSISGAARALGVSQPTMSRRLAQVESTLGIHLISRTPRGLCLTAAGERMLGTLQHMRDELRQMEIDIHAADAALQGTVRISVTETLGITWLAPALAEFAATYPHIRIEVVIDNSMVNLLSRDAHIAIRLLRPEQAELIAKCVGNLHISLFASRQYAAQHGLPQTVREAAHHRAVGLLGITPTAVLTQRLFAETNQVLLSNSLMAVLQAVRSNMGIGPVLDIVGADDPLLLPVLHDEVRLRKEIWLTAVPELRQTARLRAVYDFLGDKLRHCVC